MNLLTRDNIKLAIVGSICIGLGSMTPAVSDAAQRAFVSDADRVDGKHAVSAGASVATRRGKLVATSPKTGRLPNNIIAKAPDAKKLDGRKTRHVVTHYITVAADGTILGSTPAAESVTVSHPAVGTYCVSRGEIISSSMAGAVQSQLNGFEDLTLIVSSTVNTSACPNEIRIYTAKGGVLSNSAFTLTFALAPPA